MAGFRGTSIEQDSRFFNQEKKLLASMAFPKSFDQRVDLAKVQREVISQWVTDRLTQLLGFEDDIVVSMVINLLEPKVDERLDPRQLQVAVTGFLGKDAAGFTEELWELLLSAQANPTGIPTAILDKKKKELERAAADKAKLRQVLDGKRADAEPARRRRDAFGRDIKEEPKDRGRPQARPDREGDRRRQSPERPRFDSQRRSRDREQEPRSERRRPRSPERYGRRERYPTRSRSRSISRSRSRRDHRRSPSRSRNRSRSSPPRRRESRRSVSPRRSRSRRGHHRSRSASSASSVPSRSASPPRRRHRARSPSGHK